MKLALDYLSLPKVGESECGDAVVVRREEGGSLLAVIDALGHGPSAAEVARKAVDSLMSVPIRDGVRAAVELLHGDLRGSRGAAAMVCTVWDGHLQGCGVGNVELRAFGAAVPVVATYGTLGRAVLRPRIFEGTLEPGGCLVFFSDGISSRFEGIRLSRMSPADGCRMLMDQHRRSHDDATVLIAQVQA